MCSLQISNEGGTGGRTLNLKCKRTPFWGNGRDSFMRRVLKMALAAAAIGLTASPAWADTATVNGTTLSSGNSTTIHFGGPAGSTASADLFLMLTSVNPTTGKYDFSYTFTNTNAAVSNLADFGFTTSPTLVSITGTGMGFVLDPVNFPGGYTVDACAFSGNNCDAANNQADLFSGTFELTFAGGTSSITLNNFVDRYASLSQLDNTSGEGTPVGGVPEPATWAMMLLGFGGIGVAMRRSRKHGLAQIA
jgi:PEP-CTERM putative exosortase interaction domain